MSQVASPGGKGNRHGPAITTAHCGVYERRNGCIGMSQRDCVNDTSWGWLGRGSLPGSAALGAGRFQKDHRTAPGAHT